MRVSAKAQYACLAMLQMAAHYGEPQPLHVKAIADAHGISQRFLVQILLQLKAAGLVDSTRGAAGGYQLARSPEEINLRELIHAIDQAPPPVPTALGTLRPSLAVRAIGRVLQQVQIKELEMLEEITLADLVKQTQPAGEAHYQI
jgi:Rrf2 family protein